LKRDKADNGGDLEKILAPYLDFDGIDSALLVSADGFPVASVGRDEVDDVALAAYSAAALSAAVGLAEELEAGLKGNIALELPDTHVTLAPLTADLFLLLLGRP